jgi:uncharacterized membrane protein
VCAYALAALAGLRLLIAMTFQNPWRAGQPAILHLGGVVQLACVLALVALAAWLARRRDRLRPDEWLIQQIATVFANLAMLTWLGTEAGHLARNLGGVATGSGPWSRIRTLGAVFTSAAWTLQAAALLAIGWSRSSAFLRWMGLGLFGLTVLKFLMFDLQQVDVFWRFLTAILVGAALLSVSFLYQRRIRAARSAPSGAPEKPGR